MYKRQRLSQARIKESFFIAPRIKAVLRGEEELETELNNSEKRACASFKDVYNNLLRNTKLENFSLEICVQ